MKKLIGLMMLLLLVGLASGQECVRKESKLLEEGLYQEIYLCGQDEIMTEGTRTEINEEIEMNGYNINEESSIEISKDREIPKKEEVIEEQGFWSKLIDFIIFWR